MKKDKPKIKIGNKILKWVEPPPRFWAEGKFYSEVIDSGKLKMKYVLYPPGFESGIHNHKGQNIREWHFIISGSGRWEWYDKEHKKVINSGPLNPGEFSPMFDNNTPDHQFVSNSGQSMFFLLIEWYGEKPKDEWVFCFIDGTILDDRHRLHLPNKGFNRPDLVEKDKPVLGSVEILNQLAKKYRIFYMSARKEEIADLTKRWLKKHGYPEGELYFGDTHEKRLKIVRRLKKEKNIVAGIGDRWDDNEYHLEIGCKSIILKEYEGDWGRVKKWLL